MKSPVEPGYLVAAKYVVECVVGEGSTGVVLAARHLALDDQVAIKLLRPELIEDTHVLRRFIAEAKAARRLRGRHVARVTDFGTLPQTGCPFIVMEYLEGEDLCRRLTRGALPVHEATELVLQACEALAEAHVLGIVHRDIKPSNLYVTRDPDGSPCLKVLDFGIAKILNEGGSGSGVASTANHGMIGTVLYAAPEQLRSGREADERSDIWSLGVTLYELLCGQAPFAGDSAPYVLSQVLCQAHPPLSARARVQPELSAIIDRCLEKDPALRYQNVGELANALAPYASVAGRAAIARIARILACCGRPTNPPCDAPNSTTATVNSTRMSHLDVRPSFRTTARAWWSPWRVLAATSVVMMAVVAKKSCVSPSHDVHVRSMAGVIEGPSHLDACSAAAQRPEPPCLALPSCSVSARPVHADVTR